MQPAIVEIDVVDKIAEDLYLNGWSVQQNVFEPVLLLSLRDELIELLNDGELQLAGVGRGSEHIIAKDIRRDKIHWLDGKSDVQAMFFRQIELLRIALNRRLFIGLFEYEAHYACYGKGAFYKKHFDSFRGEANRIVSTVLYLNPNWQMQDGGELAIYDPQNEETLLKNIEPYMGTFVSFLSEEIPHAVLESFKNRYSIAGWFRCNNSLDGKISPLD